MRPAQVAAEAKAPAVDGSLLAIVTNWRVVVADLAQHFGVDLYDPAVLDRPWPGVRTMLFALLDMPESRLRRVLTIQKG
ncbi:hypothetical protein [Cellulomonas endometrii]|uniref:hypothetical protein n=1 Tax=Cellulomonas endometrii TaxID=3036301 RepID=UPI0024AE0772|nr:hypothetical protein [Cellulomonas endometrii]